MFKNHYPFSTLLKIHLTLIDDNGVKYEGIASMQKISSGNPSKKQKSDLTEEIFFNIPNNLIEKLSSLDERLLLPILWYYSSQPIMIMEDFMESIASKGFHLSPSWLPSAGGNFKNRLVNEDKMFTDAKLKIKGKKAWKLTDIGKIKIRKEISQFESNTVKSS